MPSSVAVHKQLTPIIVQVVGCEPNAVVPAARLGKDLGVDSLSIVEIVEALGLAFDVYIPDHTVNNLVTVQDAVNAVVHHDPHAKAPGARPAAAATAARSTQRREARPLPADEIKRRKHNALKFAGWFAVAGIALGVVLGFGGVALIHATGIDTVSMPATPKPSVTATTKKPTPTPTAAKSPSVEAKPKPTLNAASNQIEPGEKLKLTGTFPELDKGATLQVQVRDKGEDWDDFPVTVQTSGGGDFSTVIYTTRTGDRQIRMFHKDTKTPSPAVNITIG